jgi:hypothetical protein
VTAVDMPIRVENISVTAIVIDTKYLADFLNFPVSIDSDFPDFVIQ